MVGAPPVSFPVDAPALEAWPRTAAATARGSSDIAGKGAMRDYRKEIDGLRAVAVLPVILFHAGLKGFSGGFVGVDVFFVISGYLITGIILVDRAAGTFSLVRFYERRARRILPALFLVICACLPLAWLWLLPYDLKEFSQSIASVSLFSSNFLFYLKSGYFDSGAELKPMLHTWSLAVEEQFYLFFPLVIIIGSRWGRKTLAALLCGLAVASIAIAEYWVLSGSSAAFFLLPARCWELMVGALLAVALGSSTAWKPAPWIAEVCSALGLALIGVAVFAFGPATPWPGAYALLPTIGAAIVIACATRETWTGRLLASKFLVGIGLISYSAYLWHQPLLSFARHRSVYAPSPMLLLAIAAASLLLAYVTWRFVERPFRAPHTIGRTAIFQLSITTSAALFCLGALGHFQQGFRSRVALPGISSEFNEIAKIDNGWCFYSVDSIPSLPVGNKGWSCHLGDHTAKQKAILFGDSFAAQYEPFWDAIGKQLHIRVTSVTTNWCHPTMTQDFVGPHSSRSFKQCLLDRERVLQTVDNYQMVILGANWASIESAGDLSGSLALVDELVRRGKLVVIMPSPTLFDQDIHAVYTKSRLFGVRFIRSAVTTNRDAEAQLVNAELRDAASTRHRVLFLDRSSMFNQDALTSEGRPYSLDGGHISIYGARQAAIKFSGSHTLEDLRQALDR